MKKLISKSFFIALSCLVCSVAQAQNIAVVNMMTVFTELHLEEKIRSSVNKEYSDSIASFEKLKKEIQTLESNFQRDQSILTNDKKIELKRNIELKKLSLQSKGKDLDEDLNRSFMKQRNKFLVEIQSVVDDIAKAENYDLVLQSGAVIALNSKVDISKKVIKKWSKKSSGKGKKK